MRSLNATKKGIVLFYVENEMYDNINMSPSQDQTRDIKSKSRITQRELVLHLYNIKQILRNHSHEKCCFSSDIYENYVDKEFIQKPQKRTFFPKAGISDSKGING